MAKVAMIALMYATKVGPSGSIIHTDPEGVPEARKFLADERDVQFLVDEGVAKRSTAKLVEVDEDGVVTEDVIVASERVAETAEVDLAAGSQISGLDTRQVTNFPVAQGVHGGSEGTSADNSQAAGDDDDAPPIVTPTPPASPAAPKTRALPKPPKAPPTPPAS